MTIETIKDAISGTDAEIESHRATLAKAEAGTPAGQARAKLERAQQKRADLQRQLDEEQRAARAKAETESLAKRGDRVRDRVDAGHAAILAIFEIERAADAKRAELNEILTELSNSGQDVSGPASGSALIGERNTMLDRLHATRDLETRTSRRAF